MEEPQKFVWSIRFGRLIEAVTNVDLDEEINWLKLKAEDEEEIYATFSDRLFWDCTAVNIINKFDETIAVVPLHKLVLVNRISSLNILILKIGDVNTCNYLFNLLIIYTFNELISKQICQHFVDCFQFIYQETLYEIENEDEEVKKINGFGEKLINLSTSLNFSPISIIQLNSKINSFKEDEEYLNNKFIISTNSCSTLNGLEGYIDLVAEYLNNLSAFLSRDELNKFGILLHRWHNREISIIEFAKNFFVHNQLEEVASVKIGKLSVSASPPPLPPPPPPFSARSLMSSSQANHLQTSCGSGSSSSRQNKEGGNSFRSFFAKLRKPSEHNSSHQNFTL
ncbi:CCM2_C domain-containing protein [Meloidogyne graminicola]|uniref:CCM2_C domain-containing protein n=1 Tax=Meloidogyne graminicola TaxID=189291 RepID=A0A8S9ZNQ1_9BILA|nr:CCM2_C domain-containing protein [Meloidogyne graminicola]